LFIPFFEGRMFSRWIVTNITSARGTVHCHKTRIPCGDQLVVCGRYAPLLLWWESVLLRRSRALAQVQAYRESRVLKLLKQECCDSASYDPGRSGTASLVLDPGSLKVSQPFSLQTGSAAQAVVSAVWNSSSFNFTAVSGSKCCTHSPYMGHLHRALNLYISDWLILYCGIPLCCVSSYSPPWELEISHVWMYFLFVTCLIQCLQCFFFRNRLGPQFEIHCSTVSTIWKLVSW
jgi:hypothetical protein